MPVLLSRKVNLLELLTKCAILSRGRAPEQCHFTTTAVDLNTTITVVSKSI